MFEFVFQILTPLGQELSLFSLCTLLVPDTSYVIFIQNKYQGLAPPRLPIPSAADSLLSKTELPDSLSFIKERVTDLIQINTQILMEVSPDRESTV